MTYEQVFQLISEGSWNEIILYRIRNGTAIRFVNRQPDATREEEYRVEERFDDLFPKVAQRFGDMHWETHLTENGMRAVPNGLKLTDWIPWFQRRITC